MQVLRIPKTLEAAKEVLEELGKYKDCEEAGKALGIPGSTLRRWRQRARKILEEKGYDIPETHDVKGYSTLYKVHEDGSKTVAMEWVKTNKTVDEVQEKLQAIGEAVNESVKPLKPVPVKKHNKDDICACYVLSDMHLGMFAHAEEGGDEWNLEIAEQKMSRWIDKAVSLSPPSSQALFIQLGDFFHQDSIKPVTPYSGHVLDSNERFQRIVKAGVRGLRRAITRMLAKHDNVHVIIADGNHDPTSALWLRTMFSTLYSDEPRVTIDTSETPYYCFEWGDTSIFAHHGDKRNINDVSKTFAGLYRDVFGRTKYSYGHLGHYHSSKKRAMGDDGLMDIEIHPTIAAKDNYASYNGYNSMRRAKTIMYCKHEGKKETRTINADFL